MELSEVISRLNSRLWDYENQKSEINILLKQNIRQARIAILLAELGLFHNKPITKENEFWFSGCYLMSYDFVGDWSDIGDLYCKMATEVEKVNYFRG